MNRRLQVRWAGLAVVSVTALAFAGLGVTPSHAADEAELYVVQGLPNQQTDIEVDGKSVAKNVKETEIVGPIKVKPGEHSVTASGSGDEVKGTVTVAANGSTDVVVHLPGPGKTKPVMTAYDNDLEAVPDDKASLYVAHTAKVPPADVVVNGKVLFEDIANGEVLNLVVPVATYEVKIVPTGESEPVFLGPAKLTVKGGALNRVYAVGDPEGKTMNVAVHVLATSPMGSDEPGEVNTGTGGQAVGRDPGPQVNLLR